MKVNIKSRAKSVRPTFANVTALMALVLVMSSVAWAASLPRNSVGTAQIKRNGVTTTDIRNRAVTRSKIRNNAINGSKVSSNSLTGSDINESTLGKVPSAGTSDTVGTSFGPITIRTQSSASVATIAAARAAAAEVPMLTRGQLTFYAKCFVDSATNILYGEVIVRTSANGAVTLSTEDIQDGDPTFLDTGTLEPDRRVDSTNTALNTADFGGDDRATVIGADGVGVLLQTTTWLRNGTIAGVSPLLAGSQQCVMQMTGVNTAL